MAFDKKSFSDVYEAMVADTHRRIPALTDFEEGSVVRSLYETFAYEMALLYEQLDLVYQAGFVDTATGAHLDRVVAVLGITRDEPDFATGEVTFERDPGSDADITIPIGTLLTTEEDETKDPPKKAYVTTEDAHLAAGQVSVAVKVQAEERGRTMMAESETIIVMPRPVPGVKAVSNKKPIRFLGRDRETDEALRERAKKALLASGRASSTSIETALLSMPGVRDVRLREDFPEHIGDAAGGEEGASNGSRQHLGLGVVEVYVDGLTPQNTRALHERLDQVRAAGVYALLKPAVAISLEAVLRIDIEASIHGEERLELERRVRDTVVYFVDRLRMGEALLFSRLTREVLNIRGVTDLPEFNIVTYREADSFAEGRVRLTRSSGLDKTLSIPARTPLKTATGLDFLVKEDVQLDENEAFVTATVQAVAAGRAGELIRTGSAISWEPLTIQDIDLAVVNDQPLLLERTPYAPDAKRIDVEILERFVPENIRVASKEKPLPVHVQVSVTFPDDPARQAIVEAIRKKIKSYKGALSFTDDDLVNIPNKTTLAESLKAFVDDVANSTGVLLSKLVAGLHPSTQDALVQATQTYFDEHAREIQIDELGDVLDKTLSEDPEAGIQGRLEPVLQDVLGAFLDKALTTFPHDTLAATIDAELERVFQEGIDKASKAQQDAIKADLVTLNDKTLTPAAYAEQQRLHQQTFNDEQQRLQQNLARDREQLGAQTEALKKKVETALAPLLGDATLAGFLKAAEKPEGAYTCAPKLVVYPFQRPRQADVAVVEASFVERLVAEVIFAYSVRVELTGTLRLVLSLTASTDEKTSAEGDVRQAIEDYLDLLKPEEDVDLMQMRAFAIGHEQVLRVEYKPEACGLVTVALDGAYLTLPDRNKGESMSIEAFEKVFLSTDQFVIKA